MRSVINKRKSNLGHFECYKLREAQQQVMVLPGNTEGGQGTDKGSVQSDLFGWRRELRLTF